MAGVRLFVLVVVALALGTSLREEKDVITDSGTPVTIQVLPVRFPVIIPGLRKGKGLSGGFTIN
jgi:hypothetical protein